ncbi:hypothetical protein VNO80_24810 [Phaseolus coccineus]|uniref:Uncharacterized protein n=1 Tax=Phaseolus coccineus TaxID=3886 RepID=A0AAN9QN66_PHACN
MDFSFHEKKFFNYSYLVKVWSLLRQALLNFTLLTSHSFIPTTTTLPLPESSHFPPNLIKTSFRSHLSVCTTLKVVLSCFVWS